MVTRGPPKGGSAAVVVTHHSIGVTITDGAFRGREEKCLANIMACPPLHENCVPAAQTWPSRVVA